MTLTAVVIVVPVVLWLVYTAIAKAVFGQKTISQAMRDAAWSFNSAPFAVGIVCGHWFAPLKHPEFHAVGNVMPLLAVMLAADFYLLIKKERSRSWTRYPLLWFALGVLAGTFLWSQRLR